MSDSSDIYSSYEEIPEIGQGSYHERWARIRRHRFHTHSDRDFQNKIDDSDEKENTERSRSKSRGSVKRNSSSESLSDSLEEETHIKSDEETVRNSNSKRKNKSKTKKVFTSTINVKPYTFNCAHAAMQGKRPTMEDAFSVDRYYHYNLHAIFDGHGGAVGSAKVSQFLFKIFSKRADRMRLAKNKIRSKSRERGSALAASISSSENSSNHPKNRRQIKSEYTNCNTFFSFTNTELETLMTDTLSEMDNYLYDILDGDDATDGTTVIWLIVNTKNKNLHIANLGDSRCLVTQNRNRIFMTSDHKPNNESERVRIYQHGGHIFMDRVNGDLALSRALGDFGLKNRPFKGYNKTFSGYMPKIPKENKLTGDLVSNVPDITHLTNGFDFKFSDGPLKILLACDGVFDVYDDEEDVLPDFREKCSIDDLIALIDKFVTWPENNDEKESISTTTNNEKDFDNLSLSNSHSTISSSLSSSAASSQLISNLKLLGYCPKIDEKMLRRACRKIMHSAYDLSSVDNISVMVLVVA